MMQVLHAKWSGHVHFDPDKLILESLDGQVASNSYNPDWMFLINVSLQNILPGMFQ